MLFRSTNPGGTDWGTTFRYTYHPGNPDAGTFPVVGTMYTSISGVVSNTFGGALMPTQPTDFAP